MFIPTECPNWAIEKKENFKYTGELSTSCNKPIFTDAVNLLRCSDTSTNSKKKAAINYIHIKSKKIVFNNIFLTNKNTPNFKTKIFMKLSIVFIATWNKLLFIYNSTGLKPSMYLGLATNSGLTTLNSFYSGFILKFDVYYLFLSAISAPRLSNLLLKRRRKSPAYGR